MINKAELHLIYKQIKAHPETWNQGAWAIDWDLGRERGLVPPENVCGTAFCFAGHAVHRAGYKIHWPNHSIHADFVEDINGDLREIEVVAREILGLDEDQADDLFGSINDLVGIRDIIIDLTGEDPDR